MKSTTKTEHEEQHERTNEKRATKGAPVPPRLDKNEERTE